MDAINALSRMLATVNGEAANNFAVPIAEHVNRSYSPAVRIWLAGVA